MAWDSWLVVTDPAHLRLSVDRSGHTIRGDGARAIFPVTKGKKEPKVSWRIYPADDNHWKSTIRLAEKGYSVSLRLEPPLVDAAVRRVEHLLLSPRHGGCLIEFQAPPLEESPSEVDTQYAEFTVKGFSLTTSFD